MNASIITGLSRGIRRAGASLAFCLAICAAPGIAWAQHITVDGRLSPGQTLIGPNYPIGANLGKQVGGNLFHSFGLFSLAQPETATFSGPATVTNIISRVTGGTPSSINGTITSTIKGANLYLINPSGIVFGPNGTVNVSGSFHASSADYLRMSDGARFQATNPDGSTLSAAPPAAFGFLNATPGAITVNGSTLGVPAGQTIGLVGGPVTIGSGTNAAGQSVDATLAAPSGTIHVTSAAGTGEVPVDPTNASALTVATLGPVAVTGAIASGVPTTLDVSDFIHKTSGGSIFIRSGTLTIADGFLDATNYGSGLGGQISLLGASQIALSNGAVIHAPATTAGRGGDIFLTTGSGGGIAASGGALVDVGSASVRGSVPSGGSGQLTVTTGTLALSSGAIFGSDVQGSGNTGPVSITANSIVLDGTAPASSAALTGIRSTTVGGSANAADMTINTGTLTILANGEIVTNTFGMGNAARVWVAATGPLSIDATGAKFSTGIGSVASPGSTGNAGNVTISAASLSLVGSSGPLSPSPAAPASNPFAGLSAQTLSSGNGGSIALDLGPGPFAMSNGAVISSSTSAAGQGGVLNIAGQGPLLMSGAGTAITAASLAGASGNAGSVTVGAGSLTIQGGAQIASSTAGPGSGGAVAVGVASNILLSGPGPQITARSSGSGDAGSIMVSALNLTMTGGAAISTEAATANGGNIALAVADFLHLVDSQITTSVKGASGNGGNIAIDPQLMVLDRSQIIAQAVRGHGGNITIVANDFFPSADSLVSATSSLGISGTVEIIGPRVDLNGSLVVLPSERRAAAAIFRDSCAARGNRPRSSLTQAGRGGLPQDPEATLLALHIADRDFAPSPPAAGRHDAAGNPALTAVRIKMHCG